MLARLRWPGLTAGFGRPPGDGSRSVIGSRDSAVAAAARVCGCGLTERRDDDDVELADVEAAESTALALGDG